MTLPKIAIEGEHFNIGGHWVVSYVEVGSTANQDGTYPVTTRVDLTCTDKVVAFVGGVKLLFLDANNQQIGNSGEHVMKCGPAPLIGAAHSSGTFGDVAPNGTTRVVLAQVHSDDWGPVVNFFAQLIGAIIKALTELAKSVPNEFPIPPGTPDTQVDDFPYPEPTDLDPPEQEALKHVQIKLTLSAKATA